MKISISFFPLRAMEVLNLDTTRKCIIRAWKISFTTPGVSMVNKEINAFLWRTFRISFWSAIVYLRDPKRNRHNSIEVICKKQMIKQAMKYALEEVFL